MWYGCDVLYAVLYVRVRCFVVRGCAVSRTHVNVCNSDMYSVVNVYLDHLKFCVVCIHSRRYVCCSECNVVSNECNEPTSFLLQPIGNHGGDVMYCGCVCFRGELNFLNCDDICSMMRFISLLLLGMWHCVVSVVMWSSLVCRGTLLLLLFAFQSMFISIWVSRLEIAEFPDSVHRSAP